MTGRAQSRPGLPKLDPVLWLGPESLAAWHDYRRAARLAERSPRTVQSYGEALASLAEHMGGQVPGAEVIAASKADVQEYLLHVSATASHATRATRQRSLCAWFTWAVSEEIVTANPVARIPRPKAPVNHRRVLELAELRAIDAAMSHKAATPAAEFCRLRDRALHAVLREAGTPRVAELAAITVADVDLEQDTIQLTGKGRRQRVIKMSASTGQHISRYLRARAAWAAQHRITAPALWLSQVPGRAGTWAFGVSGITACVRDRAAAVGIQGVHPHLYRHTSYSRFEEQGGLPGDAMALYGWSSDTMTRHYGAAAAERRALARAARISLADI